MKIGGVTVTSCEEVLVLPRTEGENIPFRAQAVDINDEFNGRVPEPVPPMLLGKGGQQTPDLADQDYQKAVSHRNELRFAFMMIRSLEPSAIEWETVDINQPNTWLKWSDELMEAGLSEVEIKRVIDCVMSANSLDEEKIKAAREAFLRGQGK